MSNRRTLAATPKWEAHGAGFAFPSPIRRDAAGALRVGKTRLLVELVIRAHEDGRTPAEICRIYSPISEEDIRAVIAIWRENPAPLKRYLAQQDEKAAEVKAKIEAAGRDGAAVKARLLARKQG